MNPYFSSPQWTMALWKHASFGQPVVELMRMSALDYLHEFTLYVSH